MKRLAMIGLLALGTAFGSSAASAAPATSTALSGLNQSHSGIELAQYKRHNRRFYRHNYRHNYRHHRRHHYRGYNRYRGWHRYHHRPRHWRSLGCVVVGPIWYCP